MSARISDNTRQLLSNAVRCVGKNMSIKSGNKTDENLKVLVKSLNEVSRLNSTSIWRDVAKRLNNGRRRYASLNLSKIDRLCSEGEVLVVPGSILGTGRITKKLTLSALHISEKALQKVQEAGCTYKTLAELSEENPKGTNIRIMR